MQLNRVLDNLFSSAGKVRVLRELLRWPGRPMSGRRLAKAAQISANQAHIILQQLHEARVVDLADLGKTHCYTIREEALPVARLLKPLFENERALLDVALETLLAGVTTPTVAVYLFGSVARGEDHGESDLDLALVVRTDRQKDRIEEEMASHVADLAEGMGITLGSYVTTLKEARSRFRSGDAFVREVFLKGRRISGDLMMSNLTQ